MLDIFAVVVPFFVKRRDYSSLKYFHTCTVWNITNIWRSVLRAKNPSLSSTTSLVGVATLYKLHCKLFTCTHYWCYKLMSHYSSHSLPTLCTAITNRKCHVCNKLIPIYPIGFTNVAVNYQQVFAASHSLPALCIAITNRKCRECNELLPTYPIGFTNVAVNYQQLFAV